MATPQRSALLSVEDYLAGEQQSEIKHEYVAGHVYAMVGTSTAHNLIAGNLYAALHAHLKGKPCRVFMADLKVHVAAADAFYYPDIVVSCHAPDRQPANYVLTQPLLIVEVLSPSTERIDRGEKLHNYRTLESLREYVLVSQDSHEMEIHRRGGTGWVRGRFAGDDRFMLETVGLELPVAALYVEVG
jgi:Uma2 family endonuclease